jgi:hypothetical protein
MKFHLYHAEMSKHVSDFLLAKNPVGIVFLFPTVKIKYLTH